MTDVFEKSKVDSPKVNEKTVLRIDSVIQKTFIEINEAGTTTKTEPGNFDNGFKSIYIYIKIK